MLNSHRDLLAWQKGRLLVRNVYEVTADFPTEEKYGIANQIRRAAVSVPANIAEGAARQGSKEFMHFLTIARGSLAELETLFLLSGDIRILTAERTSSMLEQISELARIINGLITSLRRKHS